MIPWILLICNSAFCHWQESYDKAKEVARKEEKPLLIAFIGPNWCPHSDRLEEEILSDQKWISRMQRDVVLYKVAIPEEFEEPFSGKELKQQFHIEECPTLVLAQPSGEEIAKLSFLPLAQKEFYELIASTLENYQNVTRLTKTQLQQLQVEDLKALYAKAEKLADQTLQKNLLVQGLKADRSPYFLLEQYSNLLTRGRLGYFRQKVLRKKIQARDPENAEGSMRKLAVMDFELLKQVKRPQRAETVVAPLVKYLREFSNTDRSGAWEIELKISQYFFSRDKIQEALTHARASFELAPEEHRKEIAQSIQYLKSVSANSEF